MVAADAAVASAQEQLQAAHRRTPRVRAVVERFEELRAVDHFGERFAQAVRDEQGPAGHAHRG